MAGAVYRLLELPTQAWKVLAETESCEVIGGRVGSAVPADLQTALEAEFVEALGEFGLDGYFAAKPRWLVDGPYIALAVDRQTRSGVAIATGGWREGDDCPPFFQIATMLISAPHRGGTLLPTLIRSLFDLVLDLEPRDFPTWVALRTCNAKAVRAMAVFNGLDGFLFYPQIDGREQDALMREMAVRVASVLGPGCPFDSKLGVILGSAVPPDFYPTLPEGEPSEIQSYIRQNLTPSDRLLCLALVTTEKAQRTTMSALGVHLRRENP